MDLDRRLFKEVKDGKRPSLIRFFRWRDPAFSYGRTQGADEDSLRDARSRGLAAVQRPTGGGKVVHENDTCFTVIWRKESRALPWAVNESYRTIHGWIASTLAEAEGDAFTLAGNPADLGNGWCFQSPICSDVMRGGRKIAGGAQWRDGGGAIHQGSIQARLADGTLDRFRSSFEEGFGVRLIF